MEIKYGAEVVDTNGKLLGTVDHLMHNTLTGEISKFQVSTELSDIALFISAEDVAEATANEVKLKVAID